MGVKPLSKLSLVFPCCVLVFSGFFVDNYPSKDNQMQSVSASAKRPSVMSDISLELTQLRKNYGISFVVVQQDASRQTITAEQAVSVAFQGYFKPRDVSAMFGYMTIHSFGNAAFVSPITKAGKEYNRVVKNSLCGW